MEEMFYIIGNQTISVDNVNKDPLLKKMIDTYNSICSGYHEKLNQKPPVIDNQALSSGNRLLMMIDYYVKDTTICPHCFGTGRECESPKECPHGVNIDIDKSMCVEYCQSACDKCGGSGVKYV